MEAMGGARYFSLLVIGAWKCVGVKWCIRGVGGALYP